MPQHAIFSIRMAWSWALLSFTSIVFLLPFTDGKHCTKTILRTGKASYQDKGTSQLVMETVINTRMSPSETLCFQITDIETNQTGPGHELPAAKPAPLVWQLTYEAIEIQHEVTNRYTFYKPYLSAHCWCDCPGGSSSCNYGTNVCDKLGADGYDYCFNKVVGYTSSKGCFLSVFGSAIACCAVKIGRTNATYDAFSLPDGKAVAKLKLDLLDASQYKSLKDYPKFSVDLNTRTVQSGIRIEVAGELPQQVPQKYYYAKEDGGDVYSDVDINSVDGWDMNKMGWMKKQWGCDPCVKEENLIKSFSVKTNNCKEDLFTYTWDANYAQYDKVETRWRKGAPLREELGYVQDASYYPNKRSVIVHPKQNHLITVTLAITTTSDLLFHYDQSYLGDFTARVHLDKYSNRFANISLIAVSGSILGTITLTNPRMGIDNNEIHHFELYVNSTKRVNVMKYIPIPAIIKGTSKICLHPLSKPGKGICKDNIRFSAEPLRDFTVPWGDHQVTGGIAEKYTWEPFFNFIESLNPARWFDEAWTWTELVSMLVWLIALVVIGVVLVKVCKCCCGCCCSPWPCCFNKFKKARVGPMHVVPYNNSEMEFPFYLDGKSHNSPLQITAYSAMRDSLMAELEAQIKKNNNNDSKNNNNENVEKIKY